MRIGRAYSGGIDGPATATQPRRRPAPLAIAPTMIEPIPASRPTAEDELRDYMREINLNRYGHAAALLSQQDGKRDR